MRDARTVPTTVETKCEAAEGVMCPVLPQRRLNVGHGAFFHFLIMEPCLILKDMAGGEVAEWPNAAVC